MYKGNPRANRPHNDEEAILDIENVLKECIHTGLSFESTAEIIFDSIADGSIRHLKAGKIK